jgi:hypothetical protein
MVGYCGIDCLGCTAYLSTVKGDEKGLEQVAARFGHGTGQPQDWVCLGCGPHNQHFLATYCNTCKIRLCATGKGVSNCAECETFEQCAALQEFLSTESDALKRTMDWLRRSYLARHRQPV